MIFTRSKKVQKEYKEKRKTLSSDKCFICEKDNLVKEYKYWVLLKNSYPYVELNQHCLLCPKRHINQREEITRDENDEYVSIILDLESRGYFWRWNTKEESSFKYHIHCQIGKIKLYYKIKEWIINY